MLFPFPKICGCHTRLIFEEAGEGSLLAETQLKADLLNRKVFARIEERLGADGDVGGNPFGGTGACLAFDDLGEIFG